LAAHRITIFATSIGNGRCTGQNASPLGKGDEFRKGLNLHFLHYVVAMGLDRALGPACCTGYLLTGLAANDIVEDLPLARCQCADAGSECCPALAAYLAMPDDVQRPVQ
jgi:hypothetical protein